MAVKLSTRRCRRSPCRCRRSPHYKSTSQVRWCHHTRRWRRSYHMSRLGQLWRNASCKMKQILMQPVEKNNWKPGLVGHCFYKNKLCFFNATANLTFDIKRPTFSKTNWETWSAILALRLLSKVNNSLHWKVEVNKCKAKITNISSYSKNYHRLLS